MVSSIRVNISNLLSSCCSSTTCDRCLSCLESASQFSSSGLVSLEKADPSVVALRFCTANRRLVLGNRAWIRYILAMMLSRPLAGMAGTAGTRTSRPSGESLRFRRCSGGAGARSWTAAPGWQRPRDGGAISAGERNFAIGLVNHTYLRVGIAVSLWRK